MTPRRSKCGHCERRRTTIHWSDYAKAWLCWDCYFKLDESRITGPLTPKAKPPPPLTPSAYELFVSQMWLKLERRTDQPVFYAGPHELLSHCPCCLRGTLSIVLVNRRPPQAILRSRAGGLGRCSLGCTEDMIGEALKGA